MSKETFKLKRSEINALNAVMSQVLLKGLENKIFLPWIKEKVKVSDIAKSTQSMVETVGQEFGLQEGMILSPEVREQVQPKLDLINEDLVDLELQKILAPGDLEKLIENNPNLNSAAFELIYKYFVK